MGAYDRFKQLFEKYSQEAGKEQYLIPYFIAAHPGTTLEDMLNLALWLKRNKFRLDQVQTFLPTPMAIATAMYHTEFNPLKKVLRGGERGETRVPVTKQGRVRKLHKAFLRYHDPENWPMLREALKEMGREDLIGNGKHHLVPSFQPAGTGRSHAGARRPEGAGDNRTFGKTATRSSAEPRTNPGVKQPERTTRQDRSAKEATRQPSPSRNPPTLEAKAPLSRRGAGRAGKPGFPPEPPAIGNGRRARSQAKPKK